MPSRRARGGLLVSLISLMLLAASAPAGAATPTRWLCNPALAVDPCRVDLSAAVDRASGASRVEHVRRDRRLAADCFYVYPTVSDQPTTNASLDADPAVRAIAQFQASRFSQVCRVFAPVYRQITLRGILDPAAITQASRDLAYGDVRDAWREYLRRHNRGRGVVLIGHSQGAGHLRRLVAEDVETRPAARRRLVSALLIGAPVLVPRGRRVGGDFARIPACRRQSETGCVVSYSAFGAAPPPTSRFGRTTTPRQEVLCTNPAALGGGSGTLRPYLIARPYPGTIGALVRGQIGTLPGVAATWYVPPGRYAARCAREAGAHVLRVTASDGARILAPVPDPNWGLHLADVNLALGNLTALVRRQIAAHRS